MYLLKGALYNIVEAPGDMIVGNILILLAVIEYCTYSAC